MGWQAGASRRPPQPGGSGGDGGSMLAWGLHSQLSIALKAGLQPTALHPASGVRCSRRALVDPSLGDLQALACKAGMASLTAAERLQLLARSWTTVAEGYRSNFVARFAPWTGDTLRAFVQAGATLPEGGAIAVPACGPGQELPLLAAAFPRHRIVGIDLSEGMAALARQLVEQQGLERQVEIRVGDASRLDELAPLAGVVSVFGLQQMPQPAAVLANWTRALAPGGVLCVCFWPQVVEERGPWQLLTALTSSFRPPTDWEQGIPGDALREGAQLLQDERISHAMEWPSVAAFWDGMTRAGPWHSRRLAFGDEHMEELRQKFMAQPEYSDPDTPVQHTATARMVCLRRQQAQAAL